MNIAIYKPTKKIFFYENQEDHASWSTEIVNISKMLAAKGHKVYIFSPTDYREDIENITAKYTEDRIDKVFIFNGAWAEDNEEEILKMFMLHTSDINYILSDMRLMTKHPGAYKHIFTQSKRLYDYGAIQEHVMIHEVAWGEKFEKTIQYYFAGTERNRTKDFMEYVNRPECEWYGKSETLGVNKYIPHHEHIEKLKHAKYTICIADVNYNENGFVNDRYYEAARLGVICFGDSKWDPDELIMRKDDWRRVSSFAELQAKIAILEKYSVEYLQLLGYQHSKLFDACFGHNIYNLIMK